MMSGELLDQVVFDRLDEDGDGWVGDVLYPRNWVEEAAEVVQDVILNDPVNHPSHYTQYPVEVIQLTEHMPFLEGNVVKYVARAPFKDNKVQDLEKAAWYLNRAIEKAKAENGD